MTEYTNNKRSYRSLLSDPQLLTVLAISVVGTTGTNVASPALPGVTAALPVTEAQVGLLITAYTLPGMLFVPFAGVAADIYGRRTVILPSLFVFGIVGTMLAAANSFRALLVLRTVQGAAVSGFMPLTVTLLGDLYSGSIGSTVQGFRVGANGIGGAVAPFVAGTLAGLAWNYPFLLYGVAFIALALAYMFLPETMARINDETDTRLVETLMWYGRAFRAQLTDRDLAVLLTGGFARDFPRYTVMTFVPLFAVQALGISLAAAGTVLSIRGVVSFVVSPFTGSLSERLSRKWVLIGSMLVSTAGIVLIAAAPNLLLLGVAMGVYSVGDALFSPAVKDALTTAATDENRSGIIGGMQLVKYTGQTASPALLGLVLAVTTFSVVFSIAAAITGVYALVVFALFDSV